MKIDTIERISEGTIVAEPAVAPLCALLDARESELLGEYLDRHSDRCRNIDEIASLKTIVWPLAGVGLHGGRVRVDFFRFERMRTNLILSAQPESEPGLSLSRIRSIVRKLIKFWIGF